MTGPLPSDEHRIFRLGLRVDRKRQAQQHHAQSVVCDQTQDVGSCSAEGDPQPDLLYPLCFMNAMRP